MPSWFAGCVPACFHEAKGWGKAADKETLGDNSRSPSPRAATEVTRASRALPRPALPGFLTPKHSPGMPALDFWVPLTASPSTASPPTSCSSKPAPALHEPLVPLTHKHSLDHCPLPELQKGWRTDRKGAKKAKFMASRSSLTALGEQTRTARPGRAGGEVQESSVKPERGTEPLRSHMGQVLGSIK